MKEQVTLGILYGWRTPDMSIKDPSSTTNYIYVLGGSPGDGLPQPSVVGVGAGSGGAGGGGVAAWNGSEKLVWIPNGFQAPPGFVKYEMEVSEHGVRFGSKEGRWGTCATCQEDLPLSQMAKIRGRWYCYKNGCAQEQEA